MLFEWDEYKNLENIVKHGVSFEEARKAFVDAARVIKFDDKHSQHEMRFYCLGKVEGRIMTVRFLYRNARIRIFGAGFWREGKEKYEQK
ncbi:MAG: hypothetical protein A2268_16835 [Candidatus Raymondbacteria bacterium RifOxyA12_full_50_37]|uniref:BrnT family toxin n=1 Tax=Candidatus Raymondbacteria bacterium RIFOXYD12_FULL_49_13 TaxID=1817890 RepID=A0A1F7FCQ1_UNCRA|nr:MAG: hypothetical protein A2268_16835 [Candidatus Raymondbacteria bacterium RifOxyA12_full_50_37]OGJ86276.1 MAG: hypothetical protein A2248_16430 [Candidatus Raymondbacteria bacterium RIFOXYA2_FULL_49_16]OGJ93620.1 MAG: hypothetical protein A2487_20180 [Candidatus Raymondbacteria bacterium RifOxyC12_full_50_8]OGJ95813.1 MAG: hypothetical protein A2453_11745 [Candidatus Raymondbacteria bacterium RIFOXYC2_FULL_50_21]OGJ99056.1 MAG: hypothetical protein A2350_17335 [Candidatus Raymondbacteria b